VVRGQQAEAMELTAESLELLTDLRGRCFEPNRALVSGQRGKVDASICLIPGRLSLDNLEFRATLDMK
jgi:hypothetical protein